MKLVLAVFLICCASLRRKPKPGLDSSVNTGYHKETVSNQTPLMKQYWEIKTLHQDKILLFRMGDFYEMFFDDAIKAAPILGIALTQRNKKSEDQTPMCGMPHHSVAGPINKLLSCGLKVAICDQIEDPKMSKGLVKRAVTRVLTPGMVYDPETLSQNQSHYLASLDDKSLSLIDVTTGESFYILSDQKKALENLLDTLPVAEVVVPSSQSLEEARRAEGRSLSVCDQMCQDSELLPLGSPDSARRLLGYVMSLATESTLKTIRPFEKRSLNGRMILSPMVLRHLEVFFTTRGEVSGSLFYAIDRTRTPAGARRLREFCQFPLQDQKEIEARLNTVEVWRKDSVRLKQVRETLGGMGDLERRLSKVSALQCNGRDVLSFAESLRVAIEALLLDLGSDVSKSTLEDLKSLETKILGTLVEDPPLSTKQGHLIRKGVDSYLDELISLSTESHRLLQEMEAREKEKTGIQSLKIRYNNVFGYYIEITNTHKDKVPKDYQRKQTLASAERFITEELLDLEKKVISAMSKRSELENDLFEDLRKQILHAASGILQVARRCSFLDVETSLAWLSLERNYTRPQFTNERKLVLKASRHPVVEQILKKDFIPNSIQLGDQGCLLLTGPNMAGKSTLMRQVALTVIMAQMGSFVPAESAVLSIFDQIFTRVGASDSLSEGLSTFMVEMTETSEMLSRATTRSLLILDEVGRGTSTYDGMALAQSILEFILSQIRCHTLFATHYHELTELSKKFESIQNAHMSVVDRGGQIQFLHTLQLGPATKSYGIHVAELAGLPMSVVQRAKVLLKDLENSRSCPQAQLSLMDFAEHMQESKKDETTPDFRPWQKFAQELKEYPVLEKTPIEALNQIVLWQKSCPDPS